MKKTLKGLSVVLAALIIVLALASCNSKTLNGTYTSDTGFGSLVNSKVSYTFTAKKVVLTTTSTFLGSSQTNEYEGTYEIKTATDGTTQITITFSDDDVSTYSGTYAFEKGTDENGVETITIGLTTFVKTK